MNSTTRDCKDTDRLFEDFDNQPVTRLHVFALVVCGLGFSFDLAEIAFGNTLSAVFSAPPYSVGSSELSVLLASVYIGAVVGAPLLGLLADRFGRQPVLSGTMLLLTVASALAASAASIGALTASRALGGIALGAYPPLMFAYLTDILPAARRGKLAVASTAIGYIGPPTFIFLVRSLGESSPLGIEAWRWGFWIAGAGSLLCFFLFICLPESPRWLAMKGRLPEMEQALEKFRRSAVMLASMPPRPGRKDAPAEVKDGPVLGRAISLVALYFLSPWAAVGFTVLSGAVLVQKGINVRDSLFYLGISTLAPIFGAVFISSFVDKMQRRTFLVFCSIAMAVLGIAFGGSNEPWVLITSGLAFNLMVTLYMPVLVLFATESVPTLHRAGVTSWAWASNRLGSALVPLVLLPLLVNFGGLVMFSAIAVTLIAFAVFVALYDRRYLPRNVK
ncbi:MFS transporter [Rhizobium calliandrae]|uniref:MFS transporter n=1 Tax=Rhizobium calliandrae TaxID=1312182 RepID=A0ABT7KEQ4_9HYPH|nr:MFS transporter [Rhizobium calliandrae]MDL2406946.1 MFS transporter [Rhizobium calliandrae]